MLRIISGRFGPNCDRCLRKVSQRPVKKSLLTECLSSSTSQSGPIVVARNYSVRHTVSEASIIRTDIILIRQLRQRNNYIRTLTVCIPRSRQIGTGLLDVHPASVRQQYRQGQIGTGLLDVHHATTRQQYRKASSGSLFGAVRRFLRVRYLILGGAIGGGVAANQTYEEWKKYVPNLEWMKEYLPKEMDLQKMAEPFNKARTLVRAISNTEKEWMKQKMEDFKKWTEKLDSETDKDFFTSIISEGKSGVHAVLNPSSSDADRTLHSALPKIGFPSLGRESKSDSTDKSPSDRARQDSMNDEILNMQTKYQKEVDRLEKENKDLRKQLNLMEQKTGKKRKMKHSLIDMYSEILDVLTDFDSSYNTQDHLPRVVVVGDQSAGKTSVLEMIARARIFPRGSGEMMTRSPVKVTLSEGPFHVAQFKDSSREFDLTSASETEALRREVEMRMKKSVGKGQTVSNECIAMSVKGPGIQRMVLVDLPGIISTETTGMAPDTKDGIKKLVRSYMENPNAIVLCIQDGSLDAERSNVTDVVREIDPSGKRTIFVLTKVDLAESSLYNPNRIKSILEGRLFPMKALGYFAVVTGKGNSNDSIESIREYEDQFFRQSKLLKDGALKPTQMNTQNLSMAVSELFWKMVKENIEQQADAFKATRFNLETEWKNNFPRMRELDRDELFEKAKGEILDEIISLSLITPKQWETMFHKKLWEKTATYVFENIYLPAAQSDSTGEFNTVVDIKLTDWANHALPKKSIEVGWDALHEAFRDLTERDKKKKGEHEGHDELFNKLKLSVIEASKTTHNWDSKAEDSLRVIQRSILEDRSVQDKRDWDSSIQFMETILKEQLKRNEETLRDMVGPGFWESWTHWKYRTPEHKHRSATKYELERILKPQNRHKPSLSQDELTTVKQTLQSSGIEVDTEFIKETWYHVFRMRFIKKALQQCNDCKKGFYFYQNNVPNSGLDCHEVVLFWRLQRMLSVTSNALRQQVMNNEARRLERIIKDVLDDFLEDTESLKKLLTGRPVELAEELKKVRQIQEKIEEFIEALNREK